MKRTFILLALAALVLPAATFAASPTASARSFEIRALVLGDLRTEVSGKLWFNGTSLGASVGCNSIGGQVRVDGNVVTVDGSLVMTDMACIGAAGQAEDILIKVLSLRTFTIADGKWSAAGGAIEVVEQPAPDPIAVPPDQPIGSDPGVGCAILPADPSGVGGGAPGAIGGAPGAVGGSGAGSGGSGGGTSSGGSTGSGVVLPDPGTGAEPAPTPIGRETPCVAVNGGIDPDFGPNIGTPIDTTPESVVDTARDVLFVPLAVGFGLLLLVTVGLLVRGRPTPR